MDVISRGFLFIGVNGCAIICIVVGRS